MLILIAVILFCSALSDWSAGKDWESSEYNAELRHKELINSLENKSLITKHKEERVIQKRAIKDSNDRVLIEEIIVESIEDLI